MTDTAKQILASLESVLQAVDTKILEDTQRWAKARATAIVDFKNGPEWVRGPDYEVNVLGRVAKMPGRYPYEKLFRLAGGKSWYRRLSGRSTQDIEKLVAKHCVQVAKRRNEAIARKLEKFNIKSVSGCTHAVTHDGFNGAFSVTTDRGPRRVTIKYQLFGGYHIQCLHGRLLVHLTY